MIISGVAAILVSAVLMAVWPLVFGGLTNLGKWIVEQGSVGAGIYAFLNRLLIPFGLHHALNNVFWFDTIGLGDLTHFWAGHTSADVTWSLGMYMSGFFPCMMFGVPGAALAMIRSAKSGEKKATIGILLAGAVCAFVCGVTEPFEFAFMFAAPVLYVLYALLYGIFSWVTALIGFRAGFAFSAGATDLAFSASLPAAQSTWMIIPLGAAAFVIFYVLFRVLITRFDLKTPGREEEEETAIQNEAPAEGEPAEGETAEGETPEAHIIESGYDITAMLEGLGGKENITALDNCVTRLRVEVKDREKVNDAVLKKAGARGVMRPGKGSVQVIIGMKVQQVAEALRPLVK